MRAVSNSPESSMGGGDKEGEEAAERLSTLSDNDFLEEVIDVTNKAKDVNVSYEEISHDIKLLTYELNRRNPVADSQLAAVESFLKQLSIDLYVKRSEQDHATSSEGEIATEYEYLTDAQLEQTVTNFLREEVAEMSQEAINVKLHALLMQLFKRDFDGFHMFAFSLPERVTSDEVSSGNSLAAKIYRSLFDFSRTTDYKENPKLQMLVYEITGVIDQNPQMIGPVAMWQIARDVMWRRDVPSYAKGSLMSSMTYALAFFETDRYEVELLKNLDFEDTENYAEVAHMLEALKQFWSFGHESYAEDRVPDFYLRALRKIESTPKANYLLSVRAREILAMLEQSKDFPSEVRDLKPFKLSNNIYASTQAREGLSLIPEEKNAELEVTISNFDDNEKQITPPQWMVDEAIARGDSWVTWQPSQELMKKREELFNEMHQHASIPVEERLGELSNIDNEMKQDLLFDYEYLVSRPVRELIEREFKFKVSELTIREQFFFLNYLKQVSVAEAETMQHFTQHYGVNGMRTFLALERGDETLGDAIVSFGAHYENAGRVFSYYCELLDLANSAEELVKARGCDGDHCDEVAAQVHKNLMARAQQDLERAVRAHDYRQVERKLETYVAEAKVDVALIQERIAQPLEPIDAMSIPEETKQQIRALSGQNYKNETEAFQALIHLGLENALNTKGVRFYIDYGNHGEVIFCDSFEDQYDAMTGERKKYFGKVNGRNTHGGIGPIRITETLEKELVSGEAMYAHCDPNNPVSQLYIEHGFVATHTVSPVGKFSFEIWRSADSEDRLRTKQLPIVELLEQLDHPSEHAGFEVRKVLPGDQFPELQSGKYLTRYFTHNGEQYAVFESAPSELQKIFTPPNVEDQAA